MLINVILAAPLPVLAQFAVCVFPLHVHVVEVVFVAVADEVAH